ncbi:MAG: DUF503 domain-containing protein [Syntrophomonadaceae bacterium]|jgi:uncharacterized protein YlxP (DUF503 family)|nr:DUF503 domain-containing protein [Syntrophomonadaceae bacterium]
MYVIYGYCELFLPYAANLKDKRMVIRSITDRLKKRINISILEIKYQDLWQRSMLGFAAVVNTETDLNLVRDAMQSTLDLHLPEAEIIELHSHIVPIISE